MPKKIPMRGYAYETLREGRSNQVRAVYKCFMINFPHDLEGYPIYRHIGYVLKLNSGYWIASTLDRHTLETEKVLKTRFEASVILERRMKFA